ncbi:Atypical/Alpha protein kinase [Favolaschia claudopus]|uniref:Atypical/Alpha protein kinase n=1 Tax=Favolaschia claudopus TaxID=2862362 RepID=A0AAV9Z759_9AGAR
MEDPEIAASRQMRHERLQRSMGRPLQNLVNQPLGATTPIQELEHLKSASQKGNWTVLVHPHRGQVKDKDMGKATFILAGETPMLEVKEQIMARYNGQWTSMRDHPLDLKENECSLRFPGNIEIDTVTQDMTLQGLYTFYQSRPDRAVVNVDAKLKLPKGMSLVFEFYIKEKLYIERVSSMIDDGDDDIFTGTKRKRGSAVSKLASSKRLNTGTVSTLTSSFNPHDDFSILSSKPETSKITFTTIRSEPVAGSEGRYELTKDNTERIGYIETKPLILSMADRGKSKDVYKFKIETDAQRYVAKKIFDMGKGRDIEVTPSVNKSLLGRDLMRLSRLHWFFVRFLDLALNKGLGELADFAISDGFMILVPCSNEGGDDDEDEDAYLIEPMRTTSVVNKFTGTFGASRDTDKLTLTILAFNHFIMHDTACLLAYADLQGSYHKGRMTLFDPMTHTIPGASGTGDHGAKGIEKTIQDHKCNIFCNSLGLSSTEVLFNSLAERVKESEEHGGNSLVSGYGSDDN